MNEKDAEREQASGSRGMDRHLSRLSESNQRGHAIGVAEKRQESDEASAERQPFRRAAVTPRVHVDEKQCRSEKDEDHCRMDGHPSRMERAGRGQQIAEEKLIDAEIDVK